MEYVVYSHWQIWLPCGEPASAEFSTTLLKLHVLKCTPGTCTVEEINNCYTVFSQTIMTAYWEGVVWVELMNTSKLLVNPESPRQSKKTIMLKGILSISLKYIVPFCIVNRILLYTMTVYMSLGY